MPAQGFSLIHGKHTWKAGVEIRLNRDSTYFGISPNGEYDFGGGTAYATDDHPIAERKTQHPRG